MSEATDAYRARAQGGMGTPPMGMDDPEMMERARERDLDEDEPPR
jgi:hypothetical protein